MVASFIRRISFENGDISESILGEMRLCSRAMKWFSDRLLLRRQAMYACTHETGGGFVAGGVWLGVSRQRSRCFVAKLGLQYGCCNLGWNEFCRAYVFPANRNKIKSRRADLNRFPAHYE